MSYLTKTQPIHADTADTCGQTDGQTWQSWYALCATSTRLLPYGLGLLLICLYRLSFRSQPLDSWQIISRRRWRGVGVWHDGGSLLSRIKSVTPLN